MDVSVRWRARVSGDGRGYIGVRDFKKDRAGHRVQTKAGVGGVKGRRGIQSDVDNAVQEVVMSFVPPHRLSLGM